MAVTLVVPWLDWPPGHHRVDGHPSLRLPSPAALGCRLGESTYGFTEKWELVDALKKVPLAF
jgi:hypothetical protein